MKTAFLTGVVLLLLVAAMRLWHQADHKADRALWDQLVATQPATPATFDPAMVDDLPEPAQRFFRYAISPGTPLYTVAEISMQGRFSLGTKDAPGYMAMTAEQVLAAPTGFVWKMEAARGPIRISGSDAAHWTRFWLLGIIPVARMGNDNDHSRSAFGRYIAEAVFWTPAALLPGPDITWKSIDADTASVSVRHFGLEQSVDITVDTQGRPVRVSFARWSNANPDKVFRLQPFGGYLSEFREFGGYRLPTHVEAGNMFGTDEYFPFFIVDVTDIRFPGAARDQ